VATATSVLFAFTVVGHCDTSSATVVDVRISNSTGDAVARLRNKKNLYVVPDMN
jgi:hypothetical protein